METLLARAEAYAYGGLEERSFPLYRRVMELDPASGAALFHLVVASWVIEPQQAIDVYETYVNRFGEEIPLQAIVASAHYFLGNDEKAREYFAKALDGIESNPQGQNHTRFLAGLFYDAMGERGRAEDVYSEGIEDARLRLESYPDHVAMRLFLASFHGLIGDGESFLAESARALEIADINVMQLRYLAATHARRGESERAVELLRRSLRSGRVTSEWKGYLRMAGVSPDAPPYDQFLEENETEKQRLLELY